MIFPKFAVYKKEFVFNQNMRKTFIIILWAVLALVIAAVAIVFTAISKGKIGYVPPVEELENPNLKFATQILSEDGAGIPEQYGMVRHRAFFR